MKGKGLGPCRPTLMQKCRDVSQMAQGGMEMLGRLWDPPTGSQKCRYVSGMGRELLGRLWDLDRGLAECRYVSGMARR